MGDDSTTRSSISQKDDMEAIEAVDLGMLEGS